MQRQVDDGSPPRVTLQFIIRGRVEIESIIWLSIPRTNLLFTTPIFNVIEGFGIIRQNPHY